jgi:hypothetical protein
MVRYEYLNKGGRMNAKDQPAPVAPLHKEEQIELFRLASLIGCEPEDEERHRKDLLKFIESHYHSRIDSMLSRWPEQRATETLTGEVINLSDFGKGYNQGIADGRTILEEARKQV